MRPRLEEGSDEPAFSQGESLYLRKHKGIFKLSGRIQERGKLEPEIEYKVKSTSDRTPRVEPCGMEGP